MMVGSVTPVVSDDTRLVGMAAKALITSPLLPPMSIAPAIFEPGSSVSVSAAADSLIAVPPVPAIVPELVMTLPTPPTPNAAMPVLPEIDPELTDRGALGRLDPKSAASADRPDNTGGGIVDSHGPRDDRGFVGASGFDDAGIGVHIRGDGCIDAKAAGNCPGIGSNGDAAEAGDGLAVRSCCLNGSGIAEVDDRVSKDGEAVHAIRLDGAGIR